MKHRMKKRKPDTDLDRRVEEFRTACRQRELRVTPQRVEIYREVVRTDRHPDVDTVYHRVRQRLPNISLDTVYRTLATLENAGLLRRVDPIHAKGRFDADLRPHHHFICKTCGKIEDIPPQESESVRTPPGASLLGSVESVHLQVSGTCNTCKEEQGRREAPARH